MTRRFLSIRQDIRQHYILHGFVAALMFTHTSRVNVKRGIERLSGGK